MFGRSSSIQTSNRVTGVEMEDGTIIECGRVVSSAGYHNTFGKLVPEVVTKRLELPRRLSVGNSSGFLMANIGLRGTPDELGLTCANLWYHPTRADGDMFGAVSDFMADPSNPAHDPMIMVTFPSIKERAQDEARAGKTTCQMLCTVDHRWFEKFAGQRSRRRGPEYRALKAQWGDRLVGLLLRFYPQLDGHIELVDISTPLSIQHYLRADEGGAVGLDHSPARFTDWEVMRHLDYAHRHPGALAHRPGHRDVRAADRTSFGPDYGDANARALAFAPLSREDSAAHRQAGGLRFSMTMTGWADTIPCSAPASPLLPLPHLLKWGMTSRAKRATEASASSWVMLPYLGMTMMLWSQPRMSRCCCSFSMICSGVP